MPTEREPGRTDHDARLGTPAAPPNQPAVSPPETPRRQPSSRPPRRHSSYHQQQWTPTMVTALVLVMGFGLAFAFGLVLTGAPVEVAIPSTLVLVVGIMWRIVPGKPGGGDEKFILRLLRALQMFFGGGGPN